MSDLSRKPTHPTSENEAKRDETENNGYEHRESSTRQKNAARDRKNIHKDQ